MDSGHFRQWITRNYAHVNLLRNLRFSVRVGRSVASLILLTPSKVLDFSQIKNKLNCVATHSGWLKTPDLRRKGACNQGKETFRAKSMQSGATPPPLWLLEKHDKLKVCITRRMWVYIKVIKLRRITKDPTRQLSLRCGPERTHSLPRASAPSAPLAYNARFRVSQETGKKKTSVMGHFLPFYITTLKGFM